MNAQSLPNSSKPGEGLLKMEENLFKERVRRPSVTNSNEGHS